MRTLARLVLFLLLPSPMLAGAVFVDVPIQVSNQIVYFGPSQEQETGPPPTTLAWAGTQGPATVSGSSTYSVDGRGGLVIDVSATADSAGPSSVEVDAFHSISFVVPDFGPGMTTLELGMELQGSTQGMTIAGMAASLGYVDPFTQAPWPPVVSGFVSQQQGGVVDHEVLINAFQAPQSRRLKNRSFVAGDVITVHVTTGTYIDVPGAVSGASAQATGAIRVRAIASDADADLLADHADNCSAFPNPTQADTDGDQIGNACDCDFNNDGFCSIADFNAFLPDFMTSTDSGKGTDMDGDGAVGISDFNLFLPGFTLGKPGPSGLI